MLRATTSASPSANTPALGSAFPFGSGIPATSPQRPHPLDRRGERQRIAFSLASPGVVSMVVPTGALLAVAGQHARRLTRRKRDGQRWRALAVRDYESRALPLSYGGVVVQQRLTALVERSTPWCQDQRAPPGRALT